MPSQAKMALTVADDPPAGRKAHKSTLKSRLSPGEQEQVRQAAEEGKRLAGERRSEMADERAEGVDERAAAEDEHDSAAPSTERSSIAPVDVPAAEPSPDTASGSDAAPTVRYGKGTTGGEDRAKADEQGGDDEPSGADGAAGETRAEDVPQSDSVESSSPLKTTLTSPVDEAAAAKLREAAEAALLEVSVEEAISSREPEPEERPIRKGANSTARTSPAAVTRRDGPTWPGEDAPLEPTGSRAWRIILAIVLAAIAAWIILRALQCG